MVHFDFLGTVKPLIVNCNGKLCKTIFFCNINGISHHMTDIFVGITSIHIKKRNFKKTLTDFRSTVCHVSSNIER